MSLSSAIAAASYLPVVRDLGAAAGSPLASVAVSLLIAVQATTGLLILFGGRWVEIGLAAAVGVQVGLLALGLAISNLAARQTTLIPLIYLHAVLPGLLCAWRLFAGEIFVRAPRLHARVA